MSKPTTADSSLPSYQTATQIRDDVKVPAKTSNFTTPMASNSALLPKDKVLGLYNTSHSDFLIKTSADDPEPLYYFETHSGPFSAKPDVTCHRGGFKSTSPLCAAHFKTFSSTSTIDLGPLNPSMPLSKSENCVAMNRNGHFNITYSFELVVPATGTREAFEWRRSSSKEVQDLDGSGSGMKCIQVSNGQLLAVWTGVSGMSRKKVGKMRFFPVMHGLGDRVQTMILMSLLVIVELGTRGNRGRSRGGGGGSAGGAC